MTDSDTRAFDASLSVPLHGRAVPDVFEMVLRLLVELDDLVGPFDLRLGEDEPRGPSVRSPQVAAFMQSESGFMAMSRWAIVDVTKDRPPRVGEPDGVHASLLFDDVSDDVIRQILVTLERWGAEVGLVCGWAGSRDEERHHLFAKLKLPKGSISSYVGRDHRRVVPGLFWWNMWSLNWLVKRGLSPAQVPANWEVIQRPMASAQYALVKARSHWSDWRDHVAAAESWADDTPGVFSIREMMASKPESLNELSALTFIRQWK